MKQNELIFKKENFQSINGTNKLKYFPNEIIKVIYYKEEKKIILVFKNENGEEFSKTVEEDLFEGNINI